MGREPIVFEIDDEVVRVPREVVSGLAAAAAARAGVSTRHREISLLLGRALESGRVSIGDPEALALRAVLEEEDGERLGPAAEELLRTLAA
ncbi:MAG TPA: hypothetical protein VE995_08960 [Gaiellaceae bacterium]|nr:hypothetical protein [Gaiellaceae bacterium]